MACALAAFIWLSGLSCELAFPHPCLRRMRCHSPVSTWRALNQLRSLSLNIQSRGESWYPLTRMASLGMQLTSLELAHARNAISLNRAVPLVPMVDVNAARMAQTGLFFLLAAMSSLMKRGEPGMSKVVGLSRRCQGNLDPRRHGELNLSER